MTAQHKAEKTARLFAHAAALEDWRRLDARNELGAAMKLATVRMYDEQPTAAPLVVNVEVIL